MPKTEKHRKSKARISNGDGKPVQVTERVPIEEAGKLPEETGRHVLWNTYGWLLVYNVNPQLNHVVISRSFHGTPIDDTTMEMEEARLHWQRQIDYGNFMSAGKLK